MMWEPHERPLRRPLRWEALRMRRKGVLAGVVWGANENVVRDGVGQLSDPVEWHVI
jgi:hypothetical protein